MSLSFVLFSCSFSTKASMDEAIDNEREDRKWWGMQFAHSLSDLFWELSIAPKQNESDS
jgi:hypothetical protein